MVMKRTRRFFSNLPETLNGGISRHLDDTTKDKMTKQAQKRNSIGISHLTSQRRGQMKIQQMAFMLIAVTLFFVLVGMVILVIYMSGLSESSDLLEQERAMRLATKIANSPEFSCGEAFGEKTTCVDFDKVLILKENIDKYEGFWRVDNIMILKIFPSENFGVECNPGNYDECGQLKLRDKEISSEYSNYITLCRKASKEGELYDKCEIARILVDPREDESE